MKKLFKLVFISLFFAKVGNAGQFAMKANHESFIISAHMHICSHCHFVGIRPVHPSKLSITINEEWRSCISEDDINEALAFCENKFKSKQIFSNEIYYRFTKAIIAMRIKQISCSKKINPDIDEISAKEVLLYAEQFRKSQRALNEM